MSDSRAGWMEVEITPALGLPMGGRGPRLAPGASVLDPLCAQALALEDAQGRRSLWVSLDLIGMSHVTATPLRRLLADVAGVPVDAVLLNFSHTHSGPLTHFDQAAWLQAAPEALTTYQHWLRDALARLVVGAFERLAPATIHWHEGVSDIGINRRLVGDSGEARMGPNPDGPLNRELWALRIETRDGLAIAFAHGCHPVIVYGHAWDGISADFVGQCREALRTRYGRHVHAQFFQGLTGNVRPRALASLEEGRFRRSAPGDAEQVGEQLARDVGAALDADGEAVDLALSAGMSYACLARDAPPAIDYWHERAEQGDELSTHIAQYWLHRYEQGPPLVRTQSWPVGVLALGADHAVAHLGGEPVAEWLEPIRRWLPQRRVMAWGYTQEMCGYLPTDALLPYGGYEVNTAPRNTNNGPAPFRAGLDMAVGEAFGAAASACRARAEASAAPAAGVRAGA